MHLPRLGELFFDRVVVIGDLLAVTVLSNNYYTYYTTKKAIVNTFLKRFFYLHLILIRQAKAVDEF